MGLRHLCVALSIFFRGAAGLFQKLSVEVGEIAVAAMHGDRGPYNIPPLDERDWGGGYLHTGQPNELWSYGEDNYAIMKKYYGVRMMQGAGS